MLKIFELPKLDPANLTGYHEDKAALKRFEWRFRFPTLVGALVLFGGPLATIIFKMPHAWVAVLLLAGFFIIVLTLLLMFKSAAISRSGHPMKMYWSSAPKPGNHEALYVCEHSKTYFIRVWGTPSRDS